MIPCRCRRIKTDSIVSFSWRYQKDFMTYLGFEGMCHERDPRAEYFLGDTIMWHAWVFSQIRLTVRLGTEITLKLIIGDQKPV